jgi:hypothetical protein
MLTRIYEGGCERWIENPHPPIPLCLLVFGYLIAKLFKNWLWILRVCDTLKLASCSNVGFSQWKLHVFRVLTRNSEWASNFAPGDQWIKRFNRERFPMVLRKWKSFFFDRRNTLFNSEFNTNSEYVILFQKYFEQKKWIYRHLCFILYY